MIVMEKVILCRNNVMKFITKEKVRIANHLEGEVHVVKYYLFGLILIWEREYGGVFDTINKKIII